MAGMMVQMETYVKWQSGERRIPPNYKDLVKSIKKALSTNEWKTKLDVTVRSEPFKEWCISVGNPIRQGPIKAQPLLINSMEAMLKLLMCGQCVADNNDFNELSTTFVHAQGLFAFRYVADRLPAL